MSPLLLAEISQPWWPAIGAPLANHLWQSTLFAGVIAVLTHLLRKNHARTRHFLWLLASMKFLVPFFLVVAACSHLVWSKSFAAPQPELILVMQDFSQPFAAAAAIHHIAPAAAPSHSLAARAFPILILLVWFSGFTAVLLFWLLRSRRIAAAIRGVQPANSSREIDLLRHLEQTTGITRPINLIYSTFALEPGILGIFRPVLLLPLGISDRLNDTQLQSILTHELCHVRGRDNLAAVLHMLVEALFWFYPLVWWLGARLVDERERACDEEVLGLGTDPQTYAESILKICKFYVESPLACAAGVTGSNLKKRIEVIMQNRAPLDLSFTRKVLIGSSALLAMAIPITFGLLHPTQTLAQSENAATVAASAVFESVYLQPNTTGEPMPPFVVHGRPMQAVQFKPDRFMATNFSLRDLIKMAFGVQSDQIMGGPDWLNSEKFDVNATLVSSEKDKLNKLPKEESRFEQKKLLQALLADRFKLVTHRETREVPVFALVVAQSGSKIQPAKPDDSYANGIQCCGGRPAGAGGGWNPKHGEWVGQGVPIADLVRVVLSQQQLGRPVLDQTGLKGDYDFTLLWVADPSFGPNDLTLAAALEQQLGLKLEPQADSVNLLIIDHAERVPASTPAQLVTDSGGKP